MKLTIGVIFLIGCLVFDGNCQRILGPTGKSIFKKGNLNILVKISCENTFHFHSQFQRYKCNKNILFYQLLGLIVNTWVPLFAKIALHTRPSGLYLIVDLFKYLEPFDKCLGQSDFPCLISLIGIYIKIWKKIIPQLDDDKMRNAISTLYKENKKLKKALEKGALKDQFRILDQSLNAAALGVGYKE